DLQVTINDAQTVITLSASAEVDTSFMGLVGIDTITVSAHAEVTRAVSGLELVLVLDNTGFMSGTKLDNLKIAATDLVNIVFGTGDTPDDLYVGLVPFSQAVNIGTTHSAWMNTTYGGDFDWGPTSWMGCVDARSDGLDVTDDPPSSQLFKAYYWPDDDNNNWIRYGEYRTPLSTSRGPNKNCPQQVSPLTNTKQTMLDAIDDMQARGNTHIGLGAAWGWRMLSPRWRGLWGGEMDAKGLPLDYNARRMNKAAVIMTDGENTMSNGSHSAYWYLRDGRLGTTSSTDARTALDTRLERVCTSMKNKGIVVYTVAFGSPGTSIQNLMRSCASQADFYFDSPTNEELQAAFKTIGDSLSNLRLSR
ncbi:MAG: hypothetical protein KDI15_13190, partial [Thiothrix sp.]|nr:hypothetical protein [Thiothrix sp.]